MANTSAPFGFAQYFGGAGAAPTFSQTARRIASGNTTAIYSGDPVMPVVSTANGYITQAAAGTTTLAGVFAGCKYLSTSQKRTVWSRYWPGSDATGDVEAYVIDDPNSRFLVQSSWTTPLATSLTTYGTTPVGQYCQFSIGTGNANTGSSGSFVSSLATTVTLPFIVVDLQTFPPGSNGADPTTRYYNVVVGFNNEAWRSNGAGPTGIA